jgi:hypothetical protein
MYSRIDHTLEILHIEKKGQLLNTLRHFHIYSLCNQKLQMIDTFTDIHNPIFDQVIKHTHHNNTYPTKTPPLQATHDPNNIPTMTLNIS